MDRIDIGNILNLTHMESLEGRMETYKDYKDMVDNGEVIRRDLYMVLILVDDKDLSHGYLDEFMALDRVGWVELWNHIQE